MKKIKLTKGIQIVLISLLLIVAVVIVIGFFQNNNTMAATQTCPQCTLEELEAIAPEDPKDPNHYWTCPNLACRYTTPGTHTWGKYWDYTPIDNIKHSYLKACSACGVETVGEDWCYSYLINYKDLGGGKHNAQCSKCKVWYALYHVDDNNDEKCDGCSANLHVCDYTEKVPTKIDGDDTYHKIIKKCSCGNTKDDGTTEEHSFGTPVDQKNGMHKSICSECEYEKNEQHQSVTDVGKEPTCTETGLTEGSHCSVCKVVIVAQETIQALGHTEVTDARVEPTCTETGLTEGSHCSVCNEVIVAQETIPALGHTEVTDAGKDPTCTETGLTEGSHCSVCNEVIVAQETIQALGHTEVTDAGKDPTCTETGLTEGKHCSVCNEVIVAQEEIPAAGHTEVTDARVEPTCTETGLTEGKHCSVCNEVIVAQEEIPATGHNYENGECTDCGKIDENQEEIEITSEKYTIEGNIIKKIKPKTTITELKNNLTTNATEINIYLNEDKIEESNTIITTGMTIELKKNGQTKKYTLVVIGDVNGDGDANIRDIFSLNSHRLNAKKLIGMYLLAADTNDDGNADILDIMNINRYRLTGKGL